MKLGRKRMEGKLYKQWVRHGALPPQTIPQKESPGGVPVRREKPKQGLHILYILLGLGAVILCAGLVLLFIL